MINRKKNIFFILNMFLIIIFVVFLIYFYKYNNKHIKMIVDGKENTINIHKWSLNEKDILKEYDKFFGEKNYLLINNNIERNDIKINTKKNINLKDIDNNIKILDTFELDIKDFLTKEQSIEVVENNDFMAKNLEKDNHFEKELQNNEIEVEYKENKDLTKGVEKTIQEGAPKKICVVYFVDKIKNEKVRLGYKVLDNGNKKIIEKGIKEEKILPKNKEVKNISKEKSTNEKRNNIDNVSQDSIWDKIAKYESGGRWDINTGNGYYGGLQFSKQTWDVARKAVGIDKEYPHLASREEQIKAAQWLQRKSGWGQWPSVSRKLGLI